MLQTHEITFRVMYTPDKTTDWEIWLEKLAHNHLEKMFQFT